MSESVADSAPDTAAGEGREPVWSLRADWTAPIRRRPLPIAAGCVLVVALLAWRIGARADLAAFAWLGVAGVLLAVVDVRLKRLPDPLTLTSYPICAALLAAAVPFTADGGGRFTAALIGLAALGGLFFVQWVIVPNAMGFGDVKLSGVLGLCLGWLGADAWMLGVVAMFLLGGLYSVGLLVLRRAGRKATIPFGPFMLAGTLAAVLAHA
ncbi:prepilin peptidase [Spirillospora sp. CA-253888]